MNIPVNKWIANLDEFKAEVAEFSAALGEFVNVYERLQKANDRVSSFKLLFRDENDTLKGESLRDSVEPQTDFVYLDDVEAIQKIIASLSGIQSNLQWPQTVMIDKAKAAMLNRFLKDKFKILPSQVHPDGKSSS